jgi:hypothetical protein
MMDFFTGLALGIAVGVFIVLMFIRSAVREALESADGSLNKLKQLVEEEIERTVQTRVEEHAGVYYIYNVEDGAFLGQGKTLDEVIASVIKRLPDTNVNITEGDIEVIKKLRAELKTN